MNTSSTFGRRTLLVAAAATLAGAGSALAGGPCAGEPFAAYHNAFHPDGAYECASAKHEEAGVRGPAGPDMTFDRWGRSEQPSESTTDEGYRNAALGDDGFKGFNRVFIGD